MCCLSMSLKGMICSEGMLETRLNMLSFLFLPQNISRTSPKEYCWHNAKGRMRVARQILLDCLVMAQPMSRGLALEGNSSVILVFWMKETIVLE